MTSSKLFQKLKTAPDKCKNKCIYNEESQFNEASMTMSPSLINSHHIVFSVYRAYLRGNERMKHNISINWYQKYLRKAYNIQTMCQGFILFIIHTNLHSI